MQLKEAISTLRQGIDTILSCDVPYEQLDTALKLVEEKFTSTNSAMNAICGQELSCRFQQFADRIRCGAPSVIDCRHKQHQ